VPQVPEIARDLPIYSVHTMTIWSYRPPQYSSQPKCQRLRAEHARQLRLEGVKQGTTAPHARAADRRAGRRYPSREAQGHRRPNRRHPAVMRLNRAVPLGGALYPQGRGRDLFDHRVASSSGSTVRPNPFAVLRLMTGSNLVGWKTGISLGFRPFNGRSPLKDTHFTVWVVLRITR
jgi:hypothetical protein